MADESNDVVVDFLYEGDAEEVRLCGVFTRWIALRMAHDEDGKWSKHVRLGVGKYQYHFEVDGKRISGTEESDNPKTPGEFEEVVEVVQGEDGLEVRWGNEANEEDGEERASDEEIGEVEKINQTIQEATPREKAEGEETHLERKSYAEAVKEGQTESSGESDAKTDENEEKGEGEKEEEAIRETKTYAEVVKEGAANEGLGEGEEGADEGEGTEDGGVTPTKTYAEAVKEGASEEGEGNEEEKGEETEEKEEGKEDGKEADQGATMAKTYAEAVKEGVSEEEKEETEGHALTKTYAEAVKEGVEEAHEEEEGNDEKKEGEEDMRLGTKTYAEAVKGEESEVNAGYAQENSMRIESDEDEDDTGVRTTGVESVVKEREEAGEEEEDGAKDEDEDTTSSTASSTTTSSTSSSSSGSSNSSISDEHETEGAVTNGGKSAAHGAHVTDAGITIVDHVDEGAENNENADATPFAEPGEDVLEAALVDIAVEAAIASAPPVVAASEDKWLDNMLESSLNEFSVETALSTAPPSLEASVYIGNAAPLPTQPPKSAVPPTLEVSSRKTAESPTVKTSTTTSAEKTTRETKETRETAVVPTSEASSVWDWLPWVGAGALGVGAIVGFAIFKSQQKQ